MAGCHQLNLSQPAMSNGLRRLRELCDDPLLVRTSEGMTVAPQRIDRSKGAGSSMVLIRECCFGCLIRKEKPPVDFMNSITSSPGVRSFVLRTNNSELSRRGRLLVVTRYLHKKKCRSKKSARGRVSKFKPSNVTRTAFWIIPSSRKNKLSIVRTERSPNRSQSDECFLSFFLSFFLSLHTPTREAAGGRARGCGHSAAGGAIGGKKEGAPARRGPAAVTFVRPHLADPQTRFVAHRKRPFWVSIGIVAEWSKALVSGTSLRGARTSPIPTCNAFFFMPCFASRLLLLFLSCFTLEDRLTSWQLIGQQEGHR